MQDPLTDGSRQPLVSVVVPVYNEEQVLPELHQRLQAVLAQLPGSHEVVYVDDGSEDGSVEILERFARQADDVVLVQLSRNFGMALAMSAGLDHAGGAHGVL